MGNHNEKAKWVNTMSAVGLSISKLRKKKLLKRNSRYNIVLYYNKQKTNIMLTQIFTA